MDCLHPAISQRLTPLIVGITPERRRAVLSIAQQASSWQDFLDALKQGDFRQPSDAPLAKTILRRGLDRGAE